MTRPQYAYRLHVDYPATPTLTEYQAARWDDPESQWRWPRARTFLSAAGASKRASLLRMYGATVVVERSERIVWTEL